MGIAANGGTPYSQEQILTIAFDAMYRTGLYNEKCITWEDLTNAQKHGQGGKFSSQKWCKIAADYNRQQDHTSMPTSLYRNISNKIQLMH
eukprot:11333063-Ditylum_brightwellii.AAC.1